MKLLELVPGMEEPLLSRILDQISRVDDAVFGDSCWGRDAFSESVGNSYDYLVAAVRQDGEETEVLGYGLLRCFDDAEIIMTAVRPEDRQQGIGRMLLDAMIEEAGKRNANGIFLEVREGNLPARTLYKSAGFSEEGKRKDYYHAPLEDAVIMRYIC